MRVFIVFASIFLFVSSIVLAQSVTKIGGSTSDPLSCIYFTDPDTGYIGSYWGTILVTVDGGNSWINQYSSNAEFLGMHFSYGGVGYISGTSWAYVNSFFLKIALYGLDASRIAVVDSGAYPTFLTFRNSLDGYDGRILNGKKTIIYRTYDGGKNWMDSFSLPYVICMAFADSVRACAVGADVVYRTDDNWKTFKSYGIGKLPFFKATSITFTDSVTGYAGGLTGLVYKSRDGGRTWSIIKHNLDSPAILYGGVNSICFTDRVTGYACGDLGLLMKTTDSGHTWHQLQTGTLANFHDIKFPSHDVGIVVGDSGLIFKIAKQIATGVEPASDFALSVCPNPSTGRVILRANVVMPEIECTLVDIEGQQVFFYKGAFKQEFDFSHLSKGVYTLKITAYKEVFNEKLILQ